MSQATEWLTSSSSATSLFFATSPIIASRRDKNLSCKQKIVFFTNSDCILNPSDLTYLYIIHFNFLIWYLAAKLHKTLIDSPELEVISIVERAHLVNVVKTRKKTLSTWLLPSFIQGVIYWWSFQKEGDTFQKELWQPKMIHSQNIWKIINKVWFVWGYTNRYCWMDTIELKIFHSPNYGSVSAPHKIKWEKMNAMPKIYI